MSSAGRGGKRVEGDFYPTTPELAMLLTQAVAKDYNDRVEGWPRSIGGPGSGYGSFLVACRETWPDADVYGYELQDTMVKATRPAFVTDHMDLTRHNLRDGHDLIIGNPPFSVADKIIPSLIARLHPTRGVLVLLLRLNYMGGQERFKTLWRDHMPSRVYVLPARPGFMPNGRSDSTEYALYVWDWRHTGETTLRFIDNLDVKNRWARGESPPVLDVVDVPERATAPDQGSFPDACRREPTPVPVFAGTVGQARLLETAPQADSQERGV